MSATSTAIGSATGNPTVARSTGRRPRPKTLKRKAQNREAQRKYREKQAQIIEDLKSQAAAAAQSTGSSVQLQAAPRSPSTSDDFIPPLCPNHEVGHGQSRNETQTQHVNSESPTDFFETGDLDVRFSRSFIPELTSIFNEVSVPWESDTFTAPENASERLTAVTYHQDPTDIIDMTGGVPESPNETDTYPTETLQPIDPFQFWVFGMHPSHLSDDQNQKDSSRVNKSGFNLKPSDHDTSHQWPPITFDPSIDYQTSAVYLNEYGTIDQKKDQLEPFRRLFQLDNTSENNQLIMLAIERKHEIRDIMLAGFRAINNRANLAAEAKDFLSSPFLADPYKNNLRLVRVATLDAYLSNALALGVDKPTLYHRGCPSPFYRPRPNSTEALRSAVAKMSARIPEHLRPTPPQVLCPHHPYLDLLPFPILRARAIALSSRSPPLINAAELKSDVMNEGLICWRTSGSGTGQPWDMRSWEAAPWFLEKWSVLVGGEEDEVWKQTLWWRALRGEEMITGV